MTAPRTRRSRSQHSTHLDEAAFRHHLALETRRSERSGRAVLLLLVDMTGHNGSSSNADAVFNKLTDTLRLTDCVGWYRERQIAGAVLAPMRETGCGTARQAVRSRALQALSALPAVEPSRVHVHEIQSPQTKTGTDLWA